jgi:putative CocE/NonD family hydrolase
MQGRTTVRLSIAPRFHFSPFITPAYVDYLHYDGDYAREIAAERLRFFDFYLKGIRNGFDAEPPVNIYVVNSGWRAEREWPLARQVITPFYLAAGGLSSSPGADGADRCEVDFTARSSYGTNQVNRWLMMSTPDQLMDRTRLDQRCLVYQTAVLDRDVEVTGHPVADLWVASDRADGDFFVYLTDVDESGRSLYVTEGQLRAGWARTHPGDDQVMGKLHVAPDLPWHGYRKDQYLGNPLAGGKVVELRLDLMPTSWLFRKGHRLRVAIAGADAGNFEINPYLCRDNRPEDCLRTVVSIEHTKAWPSRVELPVIPAAR